METQIMFTSQLEKVLPEILAAKGGLWCVEGKPGAGTTSELIFLAHELLERSIKTAVFAEGSYWASISDVAPFGFLDPDLSWVNVSQHYSKSIPTPLPMVCRRGSDVCFLGFLKANKLLPGSVVILDGAFLLMHEPFMEPKPGQIGKSVHSLLCEIAGRYPDIRFVCSNRPNYNIMHYGRPILQAPKGLLWKRHV